MLKNSNVEVAYQIERYTPDTKTNTINIEIAVGSLVNDNFVSDGRGLIYHTISNIPEKAVQKVESLIVNIDGQVTLSLMPLVAFPTISSAPPCPYSSAVSMNVIPESIPNCIALICFSP